MSLEEDVKSTLEACIPFIPQDGAKEVRHYLDYGEPEMAFEGCMLELIKANRLPTGIAFSKLSVLARELGLHNESVFDGEFWINFCGWGEQLTNNGMRES